MLYSSNKSIVRCLWSEVFREGNHIWKRYDASLPSSRAWCTMQPFDIIIKLSCANHVFLAIIFVLQGWMAVPFRKRYCRISQVDCPYRYIWMSILVWPGLGKPTHLVACFMTESSFEHRLEFTQILKFEATSRSQQICTQICIFEYRAEKIIQIVTKFPVFGKYAWCHSLYLENKHSFILCIQWQCKVSFSAISEYAYPMRVHTTTLRASWSF